MPIEGIVKLFIKYSDLNFDRGKEGIILHFLVRTVIYLISIEETLFKLVFFSSDKLVQKKEDKGLESKTTVADWIQSPAT